MSSHVIHQPSIKRPSMRVEPQVQSHETMKHADAQVVGKTAWDILGGSVGVLKRPVVAIPVALALIGGIIFLTITGYAQLTYGKEGLGFKIGSPSNPNTVESIGENAASGVEKRIADGRAFNRPYVFDDVTVLIRVDDVMNGASKERQVNWRIVYTVRALQQITRTDKLFKERYSTDSASVRRWFGSEKEIKATDDAYTVMMDIPAGETRTIVTGATFVYKLPLENNRPAFGQTILLASDQEFFSYPNEEDVIGELTILIESDTVKFSPVGQAAKRSKPDGSIAPDVEPRFISAAGRRSLSANWRNVMPKEEVGLHFKVD
jgi:hypothetical protein